MMQTVPAEWLPAGQYEGRDLRGVCALCKQERSDLRYCPHCRAVMCDACRGRWFSRGLEAVKAMLRLGGSHGLVMVE